MEKYKSMKRMLLALSGLLFTFCLAAQVPAEIPAEYSQDYRRIAQGIGNNPDSIYLAPIEQVPIQPSIASAQTGNYAERFFGLDEAAKQWVRDNIKRTVYVLIFDTAGLLAHESLSPFTAPELNGVYTGEPPFDGHGHGTHVASCVAGLHPAGLPLGPASVLGSDIRLAAVKVLSNSGSGSISNIERGILEKIEEVKPIIARGDAVIFNFSLGGGGTNAKLNAALKKAEDAGIYVVAASGNSGSEGVSTPANAPSAHAVAAVDAAGKRASFSTFGKEVYIAAPGVRVFGAWPKAAAGYAELNGTSMATPSHAAMAAIALATSRATAAQVSHFFADRSKDIAPAGWDKYTGYGNAIMQAIIEGGIEGYPKEGNGNPGGDEPGEGPGDGPEEPGDESPHGVRTFHIAALGAFPVRWAPVGEGWRTDSVMLDVKWEAEGWSDEVVEDALSRTERFFKNRGFGLEVDNDRERMAFWVRHFFEMIVTRESGAKIAVEVYYKEAGQWVRMDAKRKKVFSNIKRAFSTDIQAVRIVE